MRFKSPRFKTIFILAAALLLVAAVAGCSKGGKKEAFPSKGITIIVPYAAGGGTDQVARVMGSIIEKNTGQKVTIENKTGGGGSVGFMELSKAKPDGYTIILGASNISIYKVTGNANITYKDFAPIAAVNYDAPAVIVRQDAPWKDFQEFVAAAKSKEIKVGTGSPGGIWHLGAIQLQQKLGLKFNIVPSTTGGAPATTALLGGHVDAIVAPPNESTAQIESGKFRVLAVMAPDKNVLVPEAPTMKELGYDLDIRSLRGFYAPKGTPQEVVDKLAAIIKQAYDDPKYQEYMKTTGSNAIYMDPPAFAKYLEGELQTLSDLVRKAGMAKEK